MKAVDRHALDVMRRCQAFLDAHTSLLGALNNTRARAELKRGALAQWNRLRTYERRRAA